MTTETPTECPECKSEEHFTAEPGFWYCERCGASWTFEPTAPLSDSKTADEEQTSAPVGSVGDVLSEPVKGLAVPLLSGLPSDLEGGPDVGPTGSFGAGSLNSVVDAEVEEAALAVEAGDGLQSVHASMMLDTSPDCQEVLTPAPSDETEAVEGHEPGCNVACVDGSHRFVSDETEAMYHAVVHGTASLTDFREFAAAAEARGARAVSERVEEAIDPPYEYVGSDGEYLVAVEEVRAALNDGGGR